MILRYQPKYLFFDYDFIINQKLIRLERQISGRNESYGRRVSKYNLSSCEWDLEGIECDEDYNKNKYNLVILLEHESTVHFYYDEVYEEKILRAIELEGLNVKKITYDEYIIGEIIK